MPTTGLVEAGWHRSTRRTRRPRRRRSPRRRRPASSPGPTGWPPWPTTGRVEVLPAHGAEERGVPEGEDAPVRRDQPVALPGRRGRHADHRRVEAAARPWTRRRARRRSRRCRRRRRRASSPARGGGRHADHRRVERPPAHGAEERRPAVVEDASVGRRQEVAARLAGRGRHDRGIEPERRRVAVVGEVPVPEQPAEGRQHGVAVAVGARDDADHLAVRGGRRARRRRRRRRGGGPARLVLLRRGVVDGDGGRAGGVDRPGRDAGDDPAHDPAHAGDVLVALPVAELEAPGQVGVAAERAAAAPGPVAARLAEGEAAAAAAVARAVRIAVHVVAGAAAVRRVVRHPPAAHDGVLRAVVGAADGAAELARTPSSTCCRSHSRRCRTRRSRRRRYPA